ncbi:hypothetical protein NC99_38180 [Sunxiuqinia dokdonensis]|uniref:Uncharacterized protein n=1 Tax=Sunxiuqinia dokdonensis TaxID=1409788 RepID=A0A0L8V4M5_9BACT|nr:hypothetical protein NC99_38180 [Sunxiuqinia dokdonensis]
MILFISTSNHRLFSGIASQKSANSKSEVANLKIKMVFQDFPCQIPII